MKALSVLCISGVEISCMGGGFFLGREVAAKGWKRRHLLYGLYAFLYWIEGGTSALIFNHLFIK